MTTLLDKVKTLIEYAKFGMFICKVHNRETGELYFPKAIQSYVVGDADWKARATSIKGRLKKIGGNNFLNTNTVLELIDLPECINLLTYSWNTTNAPNTALKIAKLPSVRETKAPIFQNFTALEYLELGSLFSFNSNTLKGCTALKEFYVGEGTSCNLHLQHCPNLTQECLHSIIENYADMIAIETPPILWIGEENIAKIDEEHILLMEFKNINYK